MRLRRTQLNLENLEIRRLLAAVDIPNYLSGNVGAIVAAPLNVDTATGIRAAEVRLTNNTAILDLQNSAVAIGSVWANNADTQITANVDDGAGTVVIFISSSSPLTNISGSLVQLNFTIDSDATVGATAQLDLTEVIFNEGAIPVSPAPVPGADSTDGQIIVSAEDPGSGSDRISGFVFADANLDGSLSLGEGIPGVTITLRNTTTGAEQQTQTAIDGSYDFEDLAPGSYQLIQRQPVAYIDGGTNQLNVQLVEGVAREGQNFIERGLLPAFVYTRLLTTSLQPVDSSLWRAQIVQINADAESGSVASPALDAVNASAASTTLTDSAAHSSLDDSMPPAEGEDAEEVAEVVAAIATPPATPLPEQDKEKLAAWLAATDEAIVDFY